MESATHRRYEHYLLKNYAAPPLCLVKGEGSYVYDDQGRRYLDFTSGIAVTSLGHGHPGWVRAVQEQAATLVHTSNLFASEQQGRLAERLVERAGPGRLLFVNSGAEANEALLKLSRLHGAGERHEVIVFEKAFHGRTFGGMSATPQAKIQNGFAPLVPGFATAKLNDLESVRQATNAKTAAVMLETIQGEGGINPCETDFLQGLEAWCREQDLLLLIDEVQCGIGRTGHFFAYERAGIQPDAIGMAKGLAGGFPMGAIWVSQKCEDLFKPGSHGSTFGGSPLACAAAHAVLDAIEEEQLLERVQKLSPAWHASLQKLCENEASPFIGLRGEGFLVGLLTDGKAADCMAALREAGLLTVAAGTDVIRLLPPLNVEPAALEACVSILESTLCKPTPTR